MSYPVLTLVCYALGYYIVLSGPHKVSSAVDALNSALVELSQRRMAELPAAALPPPAPSRIEWLMTDRALSSMGLHARRGGMRGQTLPSIPESGVDGIIHPGDNTIIT